MCNSRLRRTYLDSSDPETFPRAKEMLKKSRSAGLPYVIVANKANLEGALKPEEIKKVMDLPPEVSVIPVVAEKIPMVKAKVPAQLKEEDIHNVFDSLFDTII